MELRGVLALLLGYAPALALALRRTAPGPAAAAEEIAWQRQVRGAFAGMVGLTRTPAQAEDGGQQPLAMQVTDQELEEFSGVLSTGCKARFAAMLGGNGSGLHTFEDMGDGPASALFLKRHGVLRASDSPQEAEASEAPSAPGTANASSASKDENVSRAPNSSGSSRAASAGNASSSTSNGSNLSASEASCRKRHGGLCFTRAHVEEKASRGGRSMRSRVDVEGNGCLPSECMGQSDLQAWAHFMRGKAKEQMPGTGVSLELHVDCTESGGGIAKSGSDEEGL